MNVMTNGLEKYMSFNISNTLIFINSFELLQFSLDRLVKNLDKNNFRDLNQDLTVRY